MIRGQRIGQAIRIAFQIVTALIVLGVGVGVTVMICDTVASRSVVIQPFGTPPALAGRGITGNVLASGVLDDLTRLQAATVGEDKSKRRLSSAWSNEILLSVPETGLSLGEVSRILRERFGHDLRAFCGVAQNACYVPRIVLRRARPSVLISSERSTVAGQITLA